MNSCQKPSLNFRIFFMLKQSVFKIWFVFAAYNKTNMVVTQNGRFVVPAAKKSQNYSPKPKNSTKNCLNIMSKLLIVLSSRQLSLSSNVCHSFGKGMLIRCRMGTPKTQYHQCYSQYAFQWNIELFENGKQSVSGKIAKKISI